MNKDIINKIIKFRDDRNWSQFHTGQNLVKALNVETAELLELFQWKDEVNSIDDLKDELADVFIFAIFVAEKYDLDIEDIIINKILKNEKKYPKSLSYGKSDKYNKLKK